MYTLIFSVGLPSSAELQERLKNESRIHADILQADYMDTYRNLTLKVRSICPLGAWQFNPATLCCKLSWRCRFSQHIFYVS
ncbi:hypothetical protein Y032_0016g3090 [Ancylostoma ceylanicum]|uniref:Hexosyltransferase n=1 Tax=Ancylostoma ceylanicum TaxID=53326 RepID=A0A016V734_9BILA|nr:hypothetical protein Y032_0016g3090 [Ancylostoma ceylanicum]